MSEGSEMAASNQLINEPPSRSPRRSSHTSEPQREQPASEYNVSENSVAGKGVNIETLEYVEALQSLFLAAKDPRGIDNSWWWEPSMALYSIYKVADLLWAIGSYHKAFDLSFQALAVARLLEVDHSITAMSKMSGSAHSKEQLLVLERMMKQILVLPGHDDHRLRCTSHIQLVNIFHKLGQREEAAKHWSHAYETLKASSSHRQYTDGRELVSLIYESAETITQCDGTQFLPPYFSIRMVLGGHEVTTRNNKYLRCLFKWCASRILDVQLCTASALPEALKIFCIQPADVRVIARQTSIVVFGHFWKAYHAETGRSSGDNPNHIGKTICQLRDVVGISEPESLATVAFILMSLGSPFFTPQQPAERSACITSTWTAQTTYDLLLKISQAVEALVSEDQSGSAIAERFFKARATIMLTQIPEEGRATKYVRSFLGNSNLLLVSDSLYNVVRRAVEDDILPLTSN